MIHVRVVSPPDTTQQLLEVLGDEPTVVNLTVARGAARKPEGDAVQFEVIQGGANEVIERLHKMGLDERGSIVLENVDASFSSFIDRARQGLGRFQQFTPVWAEVESRIRSDSTFPPSWFGLLVIAGLIGAVGIVTNSQILIVAAMVVGPEYGAIMGFAFGVTKHERSRVIDSASALAVGFGLAIVASLLLSLIIRAAGLAPEAFSAGVRPVSNLINTPDWFSVIVASLAGIVGVVSLTESRASTLIGVFISVTTIPAAADIGVSIAFSNGHEALGSTLQLLLNVAILALVAVIGLPTQRRVWERLGRPAQASLKP